MASKYYAVYRGKHSGIFTNWVDASKMVSGFSGSIYKSFLTLELAQEWLARNVSIDHANGFHVPDDVQGLINKLSGPTWEAPVGLSKGYQLYSDGSYDKHTRKYSWSYVLLNDGDVVHLDNGSKKAGADNMWQVSGEIQAVIEGLTYAHANGVKHIIVNYDLINLQKWGDDQWRAKKPETQAYKDAIKKFRTEGMVISFNKIKSHSGSEYNEMCDYLAKQALGFSKTDNMDAISADHYKMMQEALS